MSNNIATMPLPTNAGPKPLIQAAGTYAVNPIGMVNTGGTPGAVASFTSTPIATPVTALEGQWAYAVFKFVNPSNTAQLVELKDSVAVTYSFDGISTDDWVPGSFRVAALNSSGNIMSDAPSDWYDAGYTIGAYSPGLTGAGTGPNNDFGWTPVVASGTGSEMSGTIYYKDNSPFDPNTGTGVHGVVLAVQLKTDTLTETGEHVLFKVTQDTASGSAFTQSNYTEARVKVADYVGSIPASGGVGLRTFDASAVTLSGAAVSGNAGVPDIFNLEGNPGDRSASFFGLASTYTSISGFESSDVLKIGMSGTNPGLSITNFGDLSATVLNEAYLVTGIRALDGTQMNVGGIYLMQVKDAGAVIATEAAATSSTYVFVDTNRNGIADTNTSNDGATGSDLLIKLVGVDVHSLQSTNFNLV